MSGENDRLGDQLHKKEKAEEDQYFAELSRKQLEKLRARQAQSVTAEPGECPRCGAALEVRTQSGVGTAACPKGCDVGSRG